MHNSQLVTSYSISTLELLFLIMKDNQKTTCIITQFLSINHHELKVAMHIQKAYLQCIHLFIYIISAGTGEGPRQTPVGTPLFPVPRRERVSPFPEDQVYSLRGGLSGETQTYLLEICGSKLSSFLESDNFIQDTKSKASITRVNRVSQREIDKSSQRIII